MATPDPKHSTIIPSSDLFEFANKVSFSNGTTVSQKRIQLFLCKQISNYLRDLRSLGATTGDGPHEFNLRTKDLVFTMIHAEEWLGSETPSRIVEMLKTIGGTMSVADMRGKVGARLLPDEAFEWIGDDRRQIAWLLLKLGDAPSTFPSNIMGRDRVIALMDAREVGDDPQSFVNDVKNAWHTQLNADRIYAWFDDDKEGSARRSFAHQWLLDNRFECPDKIGVRYSLAFDDPPFLGSKDVLMFFDRQSLDRPATKLLIDTLKKKWSQKKYRDNLKGKQQYNCILSIKALNNLSKIAERNHMTRPEVLERLLDEEMKRSFPRQQDEAQKRG